MSVLLVVVLLTLAAYQYSEWVSAEFRAADSYNRSGQARAFALSGVDYAAAALSNPDNYASVLSENPYDNAAAFQGILVQANEVPRFQGRFSIIAPIDPDQAATSALTYRFGVTDETGKINLNALLKIDSSGQVANEMLLKLPNMTEEVANAILDWIDADDDPRTQGAESEYYSGMVPPYRCKNGPLESLEELLLVRGVTPQLLLGNDLNRNGQLDADEVPAETGLDRGWSAYLTVFSREPNRDIEGNPRIYINDGDLATLDSKLQTALGQDMADYVFLYRLYGGTATTQAGGRTTRSAALSPADQQVVQTQLANARQNTQQAQPQSISSIFALVNSSVSVPNPMPQGQAVTFPSPLNDPAGLEQYLPLLLDKVTTVRDGELPARVNINTAPTAVLAALPGLTEADVQSIVDSRPTPSVEAPDPIFDTPAWLMTEANLTADSLRTLDRYITTRTQVYRVQTLGYFDGGGPTARVEAVIDTNFGRPRILYYRDLTELGRGFEITPTSTGP